MWMKGLLSLNYLEDSCSYACNLSSCEKKAWKKARIFPGFLLICNYFYFISFTKENKTYNVTKLKKGLAGTPQQLRPITAGPDKIKRV